MFEILNYFDIEITSFILYIIMFICAWLLLRDIKCWYWRINEITRNQEMQIELMSDILAELRAQKPTTQTNDTKDESTP